jgi:hypothetical protein
VKETLAPSRLPPTFLAVYGRVSGQTAGVATGPERRLMAPGLVQPVKSQIHTPVTLLTYCFDKFVINDL